MCRNMAAFKLEYLRRVRLAAPQHNALLPQFFRAERYFERRPSQHGDNRSA